MHGDFKTSVYNDKTYLKIQAYKVELGATIEGAPKTVAEVSNQNNRMAEGQSVADDLGDDEIPF